MFSLSCGILHRLGSLSGQQDDGDDFRVRWQEVARRIERAEQTGDLFEFEGEQFVLDCQVRQLMPAAA